METKHTLESEPWLIGHGVTRVEIHEADGKIVCVVPRDDKYGRPYTETLAIAQLLAAAPKLLDACQAMIEWDAREQDHAVDFYARMDLCRLAFDKARAAIAKAEGR